VFGVSHVTNSWQTLTKDLRRNHKLLEGLENGTVDPESRAALYWNPHKTLHCFRRRVEAMIYCYDVWYKRMLTLDPLDEDYLLSREEMLEYYFQNAWEPGEGPTFQRRTPEQLRADQYARSGADPRNPTPAKPKIPPPLASTDPARIPPKPASMSSVTIPPKPRSSGVPSLAPGPSSDPPIEKARPSTGTSSSSRGGLPTKLRLYA